MNEPTQEIEAARQLKQCELTVTIFKDFVWSSKRVERRHADEHGKLMLIRVAYEFGEAARVVGSETWL